ncbi:MAG: glycosyltransferase family 4 protein [Patescibacteria group bacterium]|nr:glycosyltransferase family 4 protein [Patescibacteria group bacterium]
MRCLKIVISNYDDIRNPYYCGGGAYAVHEIAKFLAKRHDVTVVCGKYKGYQDHVIDGVQYVHTGVTFGGPLTGQIFFSGFLPFAIRKFPFDVWFENFTPPHSTNMLQIFTKKPVIGITTILDAQKFSDKYHLPFFVIENHGLKLYKYLIALSPAIQQRIFEKNNKAEIRVIPLGISREYFESKTSEGSYVYFLGRLDIYQKGLDLLVDAWAIVSRQYPNISLKIIGEGTPKDHKKLEEHIKKLNLQNTVYLTGRKSGEEKIRLMQHGIAAVFPSRFETFGLAVLESLAVGKPVICSDIEGFSWIDPKACVKIPLSDSEKLAHSIIEVIRNKRLRMMYKEKSKKFAKSFAWNRIAEQYETFAFDIACKK